MSMFILECESCPKRDNLRALTCTRLQQDIVADVLKRRKTNDRVALAHVLHQLASRPVPALLQSAVVVQDLCGPNASDAQTLVAVRHQETKLQFPSDVKHRLRLLAHERARLTTRGGVDKVGAILRDAPAKGVATHHDALNSEHVACDADVVQEALDLTSAGHEVRRLQKTHCTGRGCSHYLSLYLGPARDLRTLLLYLGPARDLRTLLLSRAHKERLARGRPKLGIQVRHQSGKKSLGHQGVIPILAVLVGVLLLQGLLLVLVQDLALGPVLGDPRSDQCLNVALTDLLLARLADVTPLRRRRAVRANDSHDGCNHLLLGLLLSSSGTTTSSHTHLHLLLARRHSSLVGLDVSAHCCWYF